MASEQPTTLPARRSQGPHAQSPRVGDPGMRHKQVALQSALSVLNSGAELDRPDTPDEVVTAVRRLPAVEAAYAPFPADIDPRLRAAFESRGITQLYTHQAEAYAHVASGRQVVVTTPTASGKTLCYNLPVLDRDPEESGDARAVSVSDQGARAGSDGGAARAHEFDRRGRRRSDRRAHLRRRYAAGCAPHDSHARAHRAQQSRHGALGHPAAPPAMGEAVREPAVRGDRRAARVSRRVRQSPDQRAAAAAAHLPALRIESAIHLLVRDHRQSGRARGAADRETVLAGTAERRAERREVLRVRQSAGRQSRARHPPFVYCGVAPRRRRVPAPQPAGDRLRAEPDVDGNPHHLSQGRFRGRAGHARADPRLSRRLPAAAPARDRKGPARRAGARRRLHQRARARHRHRGARCLRDGRAIRARSPRRGSAPAAPAAAPASRPR